MIIIQVFHALTDLESQLRTGSHYFIQVPFSNQVKLKVLSEPHQDTEVALTFGASL